MPDTLTALAEAIRAAAAAGRPLRIRGGAATHREYDVPLDGFSVGGRLFAVVGQGPAMDARLVTRVGPAEWLTESLFETVMDALLHAPEPPKFVF